MLREFSELERRFMEEQIAEQKAKGDSYFNTIAELQQSNDLSSRQVINSFLDKKNWHNFLSLFVGVE
jgi:hypothetical protein